MRAARSTGGHGPCACLSPGWPTVGARPNHRPRFISHGQPSRIMRMRYAFLVATAVLLTGFGVFALPHVDAQVGTSSLNGTVCVVDERYYIMAPEGEAYCMGPLPNTTVRLTKPGPLGSEVAGVDKTATTGPKGDFAFAQIPDGNYTIVASRTHFTTV